MVFVSINELREMHTSRKIGEIMRDFSSKMDRLGMRLIGEVRGRGGGGAN